MRIALALLASSLLFGDGPGVILSKYAKKDFALAADPAAKPWKGVRGVFAENGPKGGAVSGHRTEIRSRWTDRHLYLLFICPYETLNLKPNPSETEETNQLWKWDVAEVFVGTDFQKISQYKELQVSPQGEWVDLDIDRDTPKPEGGWRWNSGFKVKARLDRDKKIWYGEMQIPIDQIDKRPPAAGLKMRINFYRIQGPESDKKFIAWQPTNSPSYHVPEAFGRLRLAR